MPDFAERFKELRGPLTQRRASHLLDVTEGMLGKWERGAAQPSLETLHRIADETGATIDYIVGRTDDWDGTPAWWSNSGADGNGHDPRSPGAPGPSSRSADLDAAAQQRRRGDERRQGRSRQRRP